MDGWKDLPRYAPRSHAVPQEARGAYARCCVVGLERFGHATADFIGLTDHHFSDAMNLLREYQREVRRLIHLRASCVDTRGASVSCDGWLTLQCMYVCVLLCFVCAQQERLEAKLRAKQAQAADDQETGQVSSSSAAPIAVAEATTTTPEAAKEAQD